MKKNNQVIFSKEWLAIHPYQSAASTDLYYVRLANRVYHLLEDTLTPDTGADACIVPDIGQNKELSCILTAYFEDVISQCGIFKAFTTEHRKLSGQPLPFYRPEEYINDEINADDLRFLIWHYWVQAQGEGAPVSPLHPAIACTADAVMELFDNDYETAPENTKLKDFLTFPETDSISLHELYDRFFWLGTESYLFFANGQELQQTIEGFVHSASENNEKINIESFISMVCSDFAYNLRTELLSLRPVQWLARVLDEKHPLYNDLNQLSTKHTGYFIYSGEDESNIRLTHIATGKELTANKKSAAGLPRELKGNNNILHLNFVMWKNEWHLIGRINGYENNEELLKQIRESENEQNTFDDTPEYLTDSEQGQRMSEYLAKAEEAPEKQNEIWWQALTDTDLSHQTLKNAITNKQICPSFAGGKEETLIQDNLDFILNYFKSEY